ncbi:MAG TPA: non-heme iron oxygenase ferredoxin subunit [Thermomicrobiaceae bacterium]|nr:non-heme iron oxygenase ferredoxin subunit [Thermomicrobiaceae bacterium]
MAQVEGWVRVMPDAEVEEGTIYGFEVDGEERILTRVEGHLCALDGICTHEFAELVEGEVEDDVLWCPLHGSGFNVHTGAASNLPATTPLATYDVRVDGGEVYVAQAPREQD